MAIYRAGSPRPEVAEWADKRAQLQELYKDPDWMLQAGLGDIEFEQDLYNAFNYGPGGKDELALKGLREFSEKTGEGRWLDQSPYSEKIYGDVEMPRKYEAIGPSLADESREWHQQAAKKRQEIRDYMGQDMVGSEDSYMSWVPYNDRADLNTLGTFTGGWPYGTPWEDRNIDINMEEIQDVTDQVMKYKHGIGINPHEDTRKGGVGNIPSDYTLWNSIMDVYGHELEHTLDFDPRRVRDSSSIYNRMPRYEHPTIFSNTGIYGLNPAHRFMGKDRSSRRDQKAIQNTLQDTLFYGGRSPMDERRRYKGDTFYADNPQATGAQAVAQGYLPNRTKGAVGSQIPFGASSSRGKFEGPYGTPTFEPRKRQPSDTKNTHHFSTGGLVSLVL